MNDLWYDWRWQDPVGEHGTPPFVLGVDLGGTAIKAGIFDVGLVECLTVRQPTSRDRGAPAILEDLTRVVQSGVTLVTNEWGAGAIKGVAIATPGFVDSIGGIVRFAGNLGFSDLPLAHYISQAVAGVPVIVLNDSHAAALGEVAGGALVDGDGLYVQLGTGIGGCLVRAGDVIAGRRGQAGEIGHTFVERDGPECSCGRRGHLEALASGTAIGRAYAARTGNRSDESAQVVAERTALGDEIASEVWHNAVAALAVALTNAIVLLDPVIIVLGGGVANSGQLLLAPLRSRVAALLPFDSSPDIVVSRFADSAGRRGAASVMWRQTHEQS
jgi:glucokinase